jgi:hypothetical protein
MRQGKIRGNIAHGTYSRGQRVYTPASRLLGSNLGQGTGALHLRFMLRGIGLSRLQLLDSITGPHKRIQRVPLADRKASVTKNRSSTGDAMSANPEARVRFPALPEKK